MTGLPAAFTRRVTDVHGAAGARWLGRLGELVAACAAAWDLQVGPTATLTYHYVAYARQASGEACVLKLGVPGDAELEHEAAVLGLLDGDGAVRLRARDARRGALLLERAEPGRVLAELVPERDRDATAAAAAVLRRLWRPAPDGLDLRPVERLRAGFTRYRARHGAGGPVPAALVADAEAVFAELVAPAAAGTLLHGDLHHGNVLESRRGWLAVDPKGLVGDPAYDCGPLLHNPHDRGLSAELARLAPGRVAQLADELDLDRARVTGWGFAHAVLSELWSVEDHGAPHGSALAVAAALRGDLA